MNPNIRFSSKSLLLGLYTSLAAPLGHAALNSETVTAQLTGLTITSISILLILSGIFISCVLRLINDKNKLKENFQKLSIKNDELLEQKHQYLENDAEIVSKNLELEKRLTARTETVNKVNHELTKTLETLQQQNQNLSSLETALAFSQQKIIIIDKHYRVCFASKPFLEFSGLALRDIENQPLKRFENYICLPEVAANGLTLNKNGLIDTRLKCLDKQGMRHSLDAQIALSWSELKEILHYVIIFDDVSETSAERFY